MAKKLNSMRFLEQHSVAYDLVEFDAAIHSATGVAEAVGVPEDSVYKSLVVLPDDNASRPKPMLVLLGGNRELDLKAFARETGFKKVRMATHQEAESLTGLKVGGISPLALTSKNWPVYIDAPALQYGHILISAGQRGLNLRVPVAELIRILDMQAVACSR
jgi:Cys-tRNA(Pro)/Cys-tRNA(Cys) deacylase